MGQTGKRWAATATRKRQHRQLNGQPNAKSPGQNGTGLFAVGPGCKSPEKADSTVCRANYFAGSAGVVVPAAAAAAAAAASAAALSASLLAEAALLAASLAEFAASVAAAPAAAASAGAGAGSTTTAGASTGGGTTTTAGSSFLPQADRAATANSEARMRDLFISEFLIDKQTEKTEAMASSLLQQGFALAACVSARACTSQRLY